MKRHFSMVTILFVVVSFLIITDSNASDELFAPYRENGIIVAQEAGMAPMSFKEVNGAAKGYVVDLWRKWSAETGIPVHFYLVDWADTLTAVRDGKADVHGGLFYTEERDKFLDYSLPFFPSKGGLFVKNGSSITDFSQLDGKPVGVIEKSFYDNYMQDAFPAMKPARIKTAAQLVEVAASGEVEAFLADYPTLMYQIGSMGKAKDFRVVQFVSEQEFRAAVAEGNDEILAVVEKGLTLIDQSERNILLDRWIIGEEKEKNSWLLPVIWISVFSLLIAVLVPFITSKFRY